MRKKYDWALLQADYNSGLTCRELCSKYKTNMGTLFKARDRGDIVFRSLQDATKLAWKNNRHAPLTAETRKKMSDAKKAYYVKYPEKVPYKLYHYSKGPSYPERYFRELFMKENISLITEHSIEAYSLDFADVEKKIDIEIDGDQHFTDERIVESDRKRNMFLIDQGWIVYRIKWANYAKLTYQGKHAVIEEIRAVLNDPDKFRSQQVMWA